MKKKEQHLQHQLLLQQQQQQLNHSFPSPITSSYDKKLFSSPSSSCRYDSGVSSGSSATEVSSNASLYSSPSSSSASTPAPTNNGASSSNSQNQRPSSSSYGQYPFGDVYGSSGNFLSNSYASAAAHHDLSRSCSALPSPTIYPPTPPPSSTPWLHPAWFGSLETAAAAGYMKTPKNNPFDN